MCICVLLMSMCTLNDDLCVGVFSVLECVLCVSLLVCVRVRVGVHIYV